jgi:hypothetical protein
MLETNNRAIYLEDLKPPAGYTFDRAIATTFTLDLLALLMAPLSLTLFEFENKEDVIKDPILVLEALRKTTDRLTIFCQEGMISIPKKDSLLYSYLEPVVVQVRAETDKSIFHPKIWLMRFTNDDNEIFYRFLCLSRNLTFDKSWDTIICLEGYVEEKRKKGFSRNRPLANFIKSLPSLAIEKTSEQVKTHIEKMSNEVRKVYFEVPEGFENAIEFMPSGIQSHKKNNILKDFDRCMIISPFLTSGIVENLALSGRNNVLISRAESIDELSEKVYRRVEANSKIYIMDEAAEDPDEFFEEIEAIVEHETNEEDKREDVSKLSDELKGLHAKMYIMESGKYSWIISGSANATNPAFSGLNVEFLTKLVIRKNRLNIEKLIDSNSPNSFMHLLRPYSRFDKSREEDTIQRKLESILEDMRKAIIRAKLSVHITPNEDATYSLSIRKYKKLQFPHVNTTVLCYPITLKREDAQNCDILLKEGEISFETISLQSLTKFIGFIVTAVHEGKEHTISFVLNLPAEGMPDERYKSILLSIISNKNRFIRYLLLILMDNMNDYLLDEFISASSKVNNNFNAEDTLKFFDFEIPLLEELIRAFSRQPEKIVRISRLLEDIKSMKDGDRIIPEYFEETWKAFIEAQEGDVS